jgi:hypothetical protein
MAMSVWLTLVTLKIGDPPHGFVFMMGGGTISWNSKQQPTIVLSIIKTKYMANMQVTK